MEIVFGIISGIITGLGMGGGTILILLLTLISGIEQHIAQAINLAFFIPTSIAAIITNLKEKNIDLLIAKNIIIFGIIGAIIGSVIANNIQSNKLKKYYAIFLLIIAFYEFYKLYKEYRRKK